MWFFAFGFFIHVVLLMSIFDIYFKSPIVKDVAYYQPVHDAVADRLVLFVIDGLRAESFVNYSTMTYTRSLATTKGLWGISNTRVPTESRPGHVALIAGFYEDPSAIAKGWKENPVDFDSVFNKTLYTWCWGVYDIVDIFTKGTIDNHIFVNKYDPYDQSFSTDKNTTLLDKWVFINVRDFFKEAKMNKELNEKLHSKQILFFLHLLGTDTSGHTHKPKTENYITTLKHVDEGIREIETIIEDYYNDDGKTTFLATSDHGMTDWGSHGAGDEHETQTPYVIWGSGVQQPLSPPHESNTITNLPNNRRLDISQADIAPLMSTILGIPVPVNSIGRLPVDLLNMTLANKAKAIYSNSRQLASQYEKKRQDVQSNMISLLYKPFEPFDERKHREIIEYTEKLLAEEKFYELILLSEEIMNLSISGLSYYHNYYQRPLLILVTLIFTGWSVFLTNYLILNIRSQSPNIDMKQNIYVLKNPAIFMVINSIFFIMCLTAVSLVYVQNLPVQYYVYFTLPVILWWRCVPYVGLWIGVIAQHKTKYNLRSKLIQITSYTLGSLALGLSFTYRWMLSIPLLGMALWPFISSARNQIPRTLLMVWPILCMLLSAFSFMPVVGKQVHIELVIVAGIVQMIFAIYSRKTLNKVHAISENKTEMVLVIVQFSILVITLNNIYMQSKRFDTGAPVSYLYQSQAWAIAVVSWLIPLLHSTRLLCRLSVINTSVLTFYLLLSVSHEGLFLVILSISQTVWILIEHAILFNGIDKMFTISFDNEASNRNNEKKTNSVFSSDRIVNEQDFRRAFFFLVYIIIAFFGTGNIASLNSFEVRWVTCFITSYQPFLITGLILLKTLAPFICVACGFRAIQQFTKAPLGILNIIVLIYSNIMGIQLLYYVKNTGSWLEIGTSISQYVIVQLITIFIVLIDQLAKILTEISVNGVINKFLSSSKKHL